MRDGIVVVEIDVAARTHGSQRRHRLRHRIANGKANVFGFCSGAPLLCRSEKSRSLWLPAQVIVTSAVRRFRTPMRR
jgi:hypothetical protein